MRKEAKFGVAAPAAYSTDGSFENQYIKITRNYIDDFSDEGKSNFLKRYNEDWSLLESGLPIKD